MMGLMLGISLSGILTQLVVTLEVALACLVEYLVTGLFFLCLGVEVLCSGIPPNIPLFWWGFVCLFIVLIAVAVVGFRLHFIDDPVDIFFQQHSALFFIIDILLDGRFHRMNQTLFCLLPEADPFDFFA